MNSIVERRSVNPCAGPGRGWSWKVFLLLIAFASSVIPRLAAQPVNDNFTNAISITGPSGTISGSTIGATVEPGEPFNLYGRRDHSVWYRWTAPASGFIVFNTVGSSFDTILSAYAGSNLTALIQLDSDDDGAGFPWSLVAFPATAGQSYYLAVDGFFGDFGFFNLNWGTGTNTVVATNEVAFLSSTFSVDENTPGFATVTVVSGGGFTNDVSVDYFTTDGTAVAGVDYLSVSNTLVFAPGDTVKAFTIPILDNSFQNSNKTIFLTLSLPTNTPSEAVLGFVSNAVVTIVDDETPVFTSPAGQLNIALATNYSGFSGVIFAGQNLATVVTENETFESPLGYVSTVSDRSVKGALVTVTRTAPAAGRIMVDYYTTNTSFFTFFGTNIFGTNTFFLFSNYIAQAGLDYQPVSGTLVFDDYQMMANIIIPVSWATFTGITTNVVPLPLFFDVVLANPRPAPEEDPATIVPTIGIGQGSVEILKINNYVGFSLERSTYRADEYDSFSQGGTNVVNPTNAHFMDVDIILPGGGNGARVQFAVNFYGYFLRPGSDYADPFQLNLDNTPYTDGAANIINFPDYGPLVDVFNFGYPPVANGGTIMTVVFNNGATRRTVRITIPNDRVVEFNEDIGIFLIPIPGNPPVLNDFASGTILFDDQPAGSADREWNPEGVLYTSPRFNATPGANNTVSAVAVQPDQKTLLGGDFDHVNTVARNHVARFNFDGSLDSTFAPGTGADGGVSSLVLYPPSGSNANKILIGGAFSSYNGTARHGLARLNTNGTLDTTFSPGNGANGAVLATVLQSDGKIIVAGDFSFFNDLNVHGIMRVNPDGTLDSTFNPGFGADGIIWSLAIDESSGPERTIYVAGEFTTFDGQPRNRLVRLTDTGAVDPSFDPGLGADNAIYAVVLQDDGKLLIGGAFSMYHTFSRNCLARLNPDGTVDQGYNVGTGANDAVFTIKLQPDGKALIGGVFTGYNGTRRMGLARIFVGGSLDTSFMDTAYNQFAGLPKMFHSDSPSFINAIGLQTNGDLIIGGSFTNLGGNLSVHYSTSNQTFVAVSNSLTNIFFFPFGNYAYQSINGRTNGHNSGAHLFAPFTRQDKTTRFNVARVVGGYTPGPGNMEYDPDSLLSRDENGDSLIVTMRRVDGRLGTAEAVPSTTNITAVFPFDFTSSTSTQIWSEWHATVNAVDQGAFSPRSVGFVGFDYFAVPIVDDILQEGDETFGLVLTNSFGSITLGGEFIPLGAALGHVDGSIATIADNDFDKGIFNFEFAGYTVIESASNAVISVIRTNGSSGPATVHYFTLNGTATAGLDYTAVNNGTLTFSSGQTNATFNVPILNNPAVEFDETVILILTNATNAKLPGGLNNSIVTSTLTIVDDDFPSGRLQFSLLNYTNSESDAAAVIAVTRTGGNLNTLSVDYQTLLGTATPGVDYAPTNGTLFWNNGDINPKTIIIPLASDGIVEGPESVLLRLSNPIVAGLPDPRGLGARTNATLWIDDSDAYGVLSFSQLLYEVDENGVYPTITVLRSGGSAGTVSVVFATSPLVATPVTDYLDTNGVLTFLPGEFSKTFRVPIIDNIVPDGDKTILLSLSSPANAGLGALTDSVLTIVDNEAINLPAGSLDTTFSQVAAANAAVYALAEQVDGRLIMAGDFTFVSSVPRNHLARLKSNGNLDSTFDIGPGANDSIRALALTSEGKLLVGGLFTSINGTNRARVARLSTDGKVDIAFNPGAGADNPVFALALQPNEKVLVGGAFSTFNNIIRPGLVRLNTNGIVDTSFNTGAGFNGTVYALALQNDGKVLVGGDFISFNGVARTNFVRLNANGTLDAGFTALAIHAPVRAILVEPDGRMVIGGSFTNVNGLTRKYLARLNGSGTVDTNFLAGGASAGADNTVYAIMQQVDGRLMVAGDFHLFNGVTRNGITRLNDADGGTDPTINFGDGANGFVAALVIQPDRRIVLGGGFTEYDEQPRRYVCRIYGGSIDGPGTLEFSRATFLAPEANTNAVITVRRRGGTTGAVAVDGFTQDGTAQAGVDYLSVSNALNFPEGETRQHLNVPIIPNSVLDGDRTVDLGLVNFVNATPGPQPVSTLLIQDDESSVGFSTPYFAVNENAVSGNGTVMLVRAGATNTQISVDIATLPGGTATPNVDYIPTNATVVFLPGEVTRLFNVHVINDTNIEGNESILLALSNPVGVSTLGISNAVLNLIDANFGVGQFMFATNDFQVSEGAGAVIVSVLRTNGSLGFASVRLTTSLGTATPFADYIPTNIVLSFADGDTVKTVAIPILEDLLAEQDETVVLTLSQPLPLGGPTILTTNSLITIFDDEVVPSYVTFETNNFFVNEFAGFATINVVRTNSRRGFLTVDFSVSDGSAVAGLDYLATNGTLTFNDGENIKAFTIPIINDTEGEGLETVKLTLSNLQGSNAPVLAGPTSTLNIVDDDSALRFSSATYVVGENQGSALITVERGGVTNTDATVTYLTVPGGTAVAGLDYTPVFGTLFWPAGDGAPKTFTVPIIDNTSLNLDRTVNLLLSNAVGVAVYVGSPSNAVLTITNDETQNPIAGPVDPTFNGNFGANGSVQSISYDPASRLYVGGDFIRFHGLGANRIARLNPNGAVDQTFNTGSGASQIVYSVAALTNGTYIAGAFTNVNGVAVGRVARLLDNGAVDGAFVATIGANAAVRAVALAPASQIVLGGEFLSYEGSPAPRLARVNPNGSLDATFAVGSGPNDTVRAVAVQANGQVIIGGDFTSVGGFFVAHIARLNVDGSLDTTFDVGLGADSAVNTIAIQADGKILIGGEFVTINGVPRDRVARLNPNGSVDTGFIIGDGADDIVRAVALELDGHIIVAGAFNTFNNNSLRGVARLNTDGSLDASFNVGFGADAPVNSISVVSRAVPPAVAVMNFNALLPDSAAYTSYTESFVNFRSVPGGSFLAVSNGFLQTGAQLGSGFFQSPYEITLTGGYSFSLQSMTFTSLTGAVTVASSRGGSVLVLGNGTYFFDASFAGVSWVRISAGGVAVVDDIVVVPGADAFASPSFAIGGDFQKFNNIQRGGVAVLGSGGSATFDFDPRNIAARSVYASGMYTNRAQPGTIGKLVVGGDFKALVGVDGVNRLARLNLNGTLDTTFAPGVGADAPVRALAVQPDGKTVFGGYFTTYDFLSRAYLGRVNVDGTLDNSFNFGAGLDNAVLALALQPDGKVVIGGLFTTVYGVPRNSIARVHTNGTVDVSFTVGAGADGAVRAVALQTDGKVLIGGDFQTVNGAPRAHIARLNANGTVDATFNPGLGADGAVNAIAVTSTGAILIGGSFTNYNGAPAPRLAQLTVGGALDGSFNPGTGANDFVSSIVIQPDGLVLVGGSFTTFNGQIRNRLVRLTAAGVLDPTINFGAGANDLINTITLQNYDGKIVIGGRFTEVDGLTRVAVARLFGGTNTGNGAFQFSTMAYFVSENVGNAVLTVLRTGGTLGAASVAFATGNGSATSPADYTAVSGTLNFAQAESVKQITVPIIDNTITNADKLFTVTLSNPSPGSSLGSNTTAAVVIQDNDSVIGFSAASYLVNENAVVARITVQRTGGAADAVAVEYATGTNGTATAGVDFTPAGGILSFPPGVRSQTFDVLITDDTLNEFNETVPLTLLNPVGPATLGLASATLTIVENDAGAGVITFGTNSYFASEDAGFAFIEVLRTNGHSGAVAVNFQTLIGSATPGSDYVATNGSVSFGDGVTSAFIAVRLIDNAVQEGDETVPIQLFGASGGATLGLGLATLTIVDNDAPGVFVFSAPLYTVSESNAFATITIIRTNGNQGAASVTLLTSGGTATPTADYSPVSNVLNFASGQSVQSVNIAIVQDGLVEGTETVGLLLANPTGGTSALGTSTLQINDDEVAVGFSAATYDVTESTTNVTITLIRTGETNSPLSVFVNTSDGTALSPGDYLANSVQVNFAAGQTSRTFTVTVIDDTLAEGDEFVNLTLSNPSPGLSLGPIATARLNILDNDTAVQFSAPVYATNEATVVMLVPVLRSGYTGAVSTVDCSTGTSGTATAGLDYFPVFAQPLTFLPGQTVQLMAVTILDDLLVEGNETIELSLGNPVGTLIGAQSSAVINIVDNDTTVGFSQTNYVVNEKVTNALITIVRNGAPEQAIGVQFRTVNGTASNILDYVFTSNNLTWAANDISPRIVAVPVLDDAISEGSEYLFLQLLNPTNATVDPSNGVATLTIVDDAGAIAFASSSSTVVEGATNALINLVRSGGSNGTVSVQWSVTGGTATAGADFTGTTGTVVFASGETTKQIILPVSDDGLVEGVETVTLILSNPSNGSRLGSPASATLSIFDNDAGIIVAAGTALTFESFAPTNRVIDPGELVTIQFGLRNAGVVDANNVSATLVYATGVTHTNAQTQNYGALIAGGNTVARPFSFTALGTNGSRITATLLITNNGIFLGPVAFDFVLGSQSLTFQNANAITINDAAAASPYPAIVTVSGIAGPVNRLTVTLNNVTHGYPDDLDILLVAPNGAKVMLMSDAGGSNPNALNNVTITFDDAAATVIPDASTITTGSYRPGNYLVQNDPFPAPAPAPPYANALSAFTGINPNGVWSLYIVDDAAGDAGIIASGWSLSISTADTVIPGSDLSVVVRDTPDPVATGGTVTYTVAVTNYGPAAATSVMLTNLLPPAATFVSVVGSGTHTLNSGVLSSSLGNLALGVGTVITVTMTAPATNALLTFDSTVTAAEVDPNSGNNHVSIKTTVGAAPDVPPLFVARKNGQLVLSWQDASTNVVLRTASTVGTAADWTAVPNAPVVSNGVSTVTMPIGGGLKFFRLQRIP